FISSQLWTTNRNDPGRLKITSAQRQADFSMNDPKSRFDRSRKPDSWTRLGNQQSHRGALDTMPVQSKQYLCPQFQNVPPEEAFRGRRKLLPADSYMQTEGPKP